MKKMMLLAAAVFTAAVVNGQEPVFKKGDVAINGGVGYTNSTVAFELSADFGVADNVFDGEGLNFGVGGYFGYYSSSSFNYGQVGARGAFHYTLIQNFEVYSAPIIFVDFGHYRSSALRFGWKAFGARVMLSPNIGIYAEAGINTVTDVSAGLSIQF